MTDRIITIRNIEFYAEGDKTPVTPNVFKSGSRIHLVAEDENGNIPDTVSQRFGLELLEWHHWGEHLRRMQIFPGQGNAPSHLLGSRATRNHHGEWRLRYKYKGEPEKNLRFTVLVYEG